MSEWVPDVSEFQGNVDMSAIKNAGAAGVIIRAGLGTLRKDRNWDQNRANAERAGLPWLAYWFNYPNYNSAHDEAAMFNSVVGPLSKGCGVAADFENDANNWPNNGYGWASEFLAKAGPADYPTVWYSSPSFVNPHGLGGLKQPYWVAHYGVSKPSEPVPATLWQFTSSGSVSGVSGRCDVSIVLRGSFRDLLYGVAAPVASWRPNDLALIVQRVADTPDAHGLGAIYSFDFKDKVYIGMPDEANWANQFNPEPYKGKFIPIPGLFIDRYQEETGIPVSQSERAYDPGAMMTMLEQILAAVKK